MSTTAALAGVLTQFNPAQGVYEMMENVPLDVNVAAGKITAHIADTSGLLAGLSSKSLILIGTQAPYGPSESANDGFPNFFHYGAATLTDPSGDVQGCVSPCSAAQPWYQEVDLLHASVTQSGRIFSSNFE